MSLMSFIVCAMDKHDPLRRDVTWDGKQYVGHCRHCNEPIVRIAHQKWRKREDAEA